jgi:hypothetical protein
MGAHKLYSNKIYNSKICIHMREPKLSWLTEVREVYGVRAFELLTLLSFPHTFFSQEHLTSRWQGGKVSSGAIKG